MSAIGAQHCRIMCDKPDIDRQTRAYFVLFWTTPMTKIGILTISIFTHEHCLHDTCCKTLYAKSVLKP